LLDDSFASGGAHLKSIFTEERRVPADELVDLLRGVQVLNLATVSSSGAPFVAPVDGLFFRGIWYFGSSTESLRFRHLRARPRVSASHTRGEELAVIAHGTAVEIDLSTPEHEGLRRYYIETYGPDWEDWAAGVGAAYARLDATKMFAFRSRA